ncbi:DUF2651 family protein [Thalassobacillus pellis]|uniref:DUF2651 family protein n=1 Tax=Thalassobacillus pellis TaxID=748008 RepID=UPI001961412A|nr:DUF2651 family protein [Thalassobacillus pellis]MBM7553105.1 hypothetical protein [Thalassobacillus pellis]
MYLIIFVVLFFPIYSFLAGALGAVFLKRAIVAPTLVFVISLIAHFTYFNSSFFLWVCMYTLLAYLGGLLTKLITNKVIKVNIRLNKVITIVTILAVAIGLGVALAKPINAKIMEAEVRNHLEENGYKKHEIESIATHYNGKLNTERTKPIIAVVVFKDDLEHKYRYIELRGEEKIVQMCEYEKRPNFFVNEFTEKRPHMVKSCYE